MIDSDEKQKFNAFFAVWTLPFFQHIPGKSFRLKSFRLKSFRLKSFWLKSFRLKGFWLKFLMYV